MDMTVTIYCIIFVARQEKIPRPIRMTEAAGLEESKMLREEAKSVVVPAVYVHVQCDGVLRPTHTWAQGVMRLTCAHHQPARRCDVVTERSNVQRRCSHLAYPHTHFIILAFSIAASEFFISCFLYSSMVSGGSLRLRSSTLRSLTSHNWSATCEINRKS